MNPARFSPTFTLALAIALLPSIAFAGCDKDTDCKGDRICVQAQCTNPPADPATAPTPSPIAMPVDPQAPPSTDPEPPPSWQAPDEMSGLPSASYPPVGAETPLGPSSPAAEPVVRRLPHGQFSIDGEVMEWRDLAHLIKAEGGLANRYRKRASDMQISSAVLGGASAVLFTIMTAAILHSNRGASSLSSLDIVGPGAIGAAMLGTSIALVATAPSQRSKAVIAWAKGRPVAMSPGLSPLKDGAVVGLSGTF